MCDTPKDYHSYQELHKNEGSENYEVGTIFPKEYEVYDIFLDSVAKQLNIAGNTNPVRSRGNCRRSKKNIKLGNGIR